MVLKGARPIGAQKSVGAWAQHNFIKYDSKSN